MKFLSVFMISCCFLSNGVAKTRIETVQSLQQITCDYFDPAETMYFFDADDTLFDSPYFIGSKAWRADIARTTKEYNDDEHDWYDIFTLLVAEHIFPETVEPNTAQFIRDLQHHQTNVFGLVDRGRNDWYSTPKMGVDALIANQLLSTEIDFNKSSINPMYSYVTKKPEFYQGMFFSGNQLKGDYILKLFSKAAHLPKFVVFVDDEMKHVKSVAKALDILGIDGKCYHYTATDKKNSEFLPVASAIQFLRFWGDPTEDVVNNMRVQNIMSQTNVDAKVLYQHVIELQKEKEVRSMKF